MSPIQLPTIRQPFAPKAAQPASPQSSPLASGLSNSLPADVFTPKFSGVRTLSQPNTAATSRFKNDRVSLDGNNPVPSLVEKLDEIMTVTGEFYSKNEAFTTLIDLQMPNPDALSGKGANLNAQLESQVDVTLNVGKAQNVGIMVMSSSAKNAKGTEMAKARAVFNAIDPASVNAVDPETGKPKGLAPKPVTPLVVGETEQAAYAQAGNWNKSLSGFYKNVAARLGARDNSKTYPDLTQMESNENRLVNNNVYVTPAMLNKKKTGHGGVAVGVALKDMESLVLRKLGMTDAESNLKPTIMRVSANYIDKFVESDALQLDTTLDHIDQHGNWFLSTRIAKLDTKAQSVEGPIILVHAKVKLGVMNQNQLSFVNPNVGIVDTSSDYEQRAQEAEAWSKLPA